MSRIGNGTASQAGPVVRIRFPPAESQERTRIPRPGSGAGFRVMGLVLLSHKNPTWCIFLYINHKV
jgi:hypothetical protein